MCDQKFEVAFKSSQRTADEILEVDQKFQQAILTSFASLQSGSTSAQLRIDPDFTVSLTLWMPKYVQFMRNGDGEEGSTQSNKLYAGVALGSQ